MESEIAAARQRVAEVKAAVEREKDSVLRRVATDTTKITFEEMLEAIGDSINNIATSDEEDDKDKEEDGEDNVNSELSDDNKPNWIVGTINKLVQKLLDTFWTKQMKLKKL